MNSQNAICINVQIHAPYVTLKKYAELTGLSLDKVRKMRAAGELPIADKKSGKRFSVSEFNRDSQTGGKTR